jgi:hypothetical protein
MCYMTTTAMRRFPGVLQETWAYFEALRRLGFRPDDIFFVTGNGIPDTLPVPSVCPCVFVLLKHSGEEFSINVGPFKGKAEDQEKMWLQMAAGIADGTYDEEELQIVWENSRAFRDSVALVTTLRAKGFPLPKVDN